MKPSVPHSRLGRLGLALVAAGLATAGCATTHTATPAKPAAAAADVAQTALATAYRGVTGQPPTSAPPVPAGKTIWVVSCGQAVPTCVTPARAVSDAARAVGWTPKICDGQLNPNGWSACIRQGVGARADVVATIGLDCASVQTALKEAAAAHVTTIGVGGNDCDVTGGTKTFSAVTRQLPDRTDQQWWHTMGALQADWIIGRTHGQAKVLSVQFADALWGPWITEGLTAELATCAGCTIVGGVRLTNQDVATNALATKFSTALLQHSDANAVSVPIDGWFHIGLAQAITASGRSAQLAVIGALGEAGNLELIRHGLGEDATVGFSEVWEGWAAVDAAIRVLDGQPVVPAGVGLQVVDAQHGLPAAGRLFEYTPAVDFIAGYKKAWGVG
jgi:ribose transport system substrate-binding protein